MILLFQERGGDASLDILKILATFRRDSAIGSEVRHDRARYMKENIPGKYLYDARPPSLVLVKTCPADADMRKGFRGHAKCVTGSISLLRDLRHHLPSVDAENIWILLVGNQPGICICVRMFMYIVTADCFC